MSGGRSGPYPRMQLWHGTADDTLRYPNFGEEVKQWTNLAGVSQTASVTDQPQSGWTRARYGGTGVQAPVEAISVQGAGHVLPQSGMVGYAIAYLGLNSGGTATTTPTTPTTPTTTTSPPCGDGHDARRRGGADRPVLRHGRLGEAGSRTACTPAS